MYDFFCDLLEAFDRVWNCNLLFKVQAYGVSCDLLVRVFLGTYVKGPRKLCKSEISAGVPQGSGLEPLLFLIYLIVNGVAVNVLLMCKLFVNLSYLNTLTVL